MSERQSCRAVAQTWDSLRPTLLAHVADAIGVARLNPIQPQLLWEDDDGDVALAAYGEAVGLITAYLLLSGYDVVKMDIEQRWEAMQAELLNAG